MVGQSFTFITIEHYKQDKYVAMKKDVAQQIDIKDGYVGDGIAL